MSAPPRLFVVRFGALGDVVLITPLLRVLSRHHPDRAITVVTKLAYAPLFETHPAVARVAALEPGVTLARFARGLHIRRHDRVFDLHASLRSRLVRLMTRGTWHAYRKDRNARRRRLRGMEVPPELPVAEQFFSAVAPLGLKPDGGPAELFTTEEDEAAAAKAAPPGAVVLAPGASHFTKRWPAERWQTLAADLHRRGRRVVGLGAAAEREILAGLPVHDAFGLPIRVAAAVCRHAAVVVANDSGLMHVAAAVNTPVVAIFGPTVPAFGFAPYHARATVIQQPVPCSPCSVFGSSKCPQGHHRCMLDLEARVVLDAVEQAA